MSKKQHTWDSKNMPGKHIAARGEASIALGAGACLNRHNSNRNKRTGFLTKSSCNHRWQAFRRALDIDSKQYNWPAYETILELVQKTQRGQARKTLDMLGRTRSGGGRIKRQKAPTEANKLWDITADGKNFQTRCTVPYWHEAHHIVPNGELQESIAKMGEGESLHDDYVKLIRGGLLEEKYNLNHMHNMIILPMAKEVAYALGLPRHRVTVGARSHEVYSDKVRIDLDEIFKPIQRQAQKHRERPDYAKCKERLEGLSDSYREDILAAGAAMKAAGEREMENNALENIFEGEAAGSL